jgi:hypothetical protein
MLSRKDGWFGALATLFVTNWITLFGATMTTLSALAIITFILLAALNILDALYVGIIAFLILPGFFIFGLALIPIGAWWENRRIKRRKDGVNVGEPFPVFDFNKPKVRRLAYVIFGLTFVNVLILSTVSYRGVVYMESPEFCGKVCHTVMQPEFTSYTGSPHARVACVECHIGPGAPWFVRSKLSGVRQVFAVAFHTYEHPIPTPVANLRPSQDTCEQCHWPSRFAGDRLKVIEQFAADEANTPTKIVLLMHIGGGHGAGHGIHSWHIDPNKQTTYFTSDPKREKIDVVQVREKDGTVTEYAAAGPDGKPISTQGLTARRMDCIDCHNRPTHIFRMPDQALDEAMANGRIDTTLPYVKKIGTEVLGDAKGNEGDLQAIAEKVRAFYKKDYADRYAQLEPNIEKAVTAMQSIYQRNVFPAMDVTWGTYSNNLGHTTSIGCFRCHDESHTSKDGKTISQDCTLCHNMLAEEENPEILTQLGLQQPAEPPATETPAAAPEQTPTEPAPTAQ